MIQVPGALESLFYQSPNKIKGLFTHQIFLSDFTFCCYFDKNNPDQKCVCFACRQKIILQSVASLKNSTILIFETWIKNSLSNIIFVKIASVYEIGH
jgi:hypothetical protein